MDLAIGAMLGMAYSAAPGPVNFETIRRGAVTGIRAGLSIRIGAGLGTAVFACLALLGAGILLMNPAMQVWLGVAGAAVLICLGWSAVRQGWWGQAAEHVRAHMTTSGAGLPQAVRQPDRRGVRAVFLDWHLCGLGAVLALTNPLGIVFWLSIDGTILHHAHRNAALFLGGFFLSVLVWSCGLPVVVWWGRALLRGRLLAWLSLTCGSGLMVFGAAFWQVVLPNLR